MAKNGCWHGKWGNVIDRRQNYFRRPGDRRASELMSGSKGARSVREEWRNASVAEDVVEVQAAEFAVDERLLADSAQHGAVITVEHHQQEFGHTLGKGHRIDGYVAVFDFGIVEELGLGQKGEVFFDRDYGGGCYGFGYGYFEMVEAPLFRCFRVKGHGRELAGCFDFVEKFVE